ncbi:MAG: hypothetical protein ABI541_06235 [Betaproteobacteria bacterium]
MNMLISTGVVAFAYVAGRWALAGGLAPGFRQSALALHTLALVLGVALLTPWLVILAGAGLFDAQVLGITGWIGAAIGVVRRPLSASDLRTFSVQDAFALAAAGIFAIAAASGRDETLGSGRDQQIYAESAVALSERGTSSSEYSSLDNADRRLVRSLGGVRVPGLTAVRNGFDQPIGTTHPLGWPVWLALAHSAVGIQGVYAANALVFALGGLLFFVLLRRLVAPGIALAGTCLFFALPSSLWIAGISLSEPLAMTLLLAVPLLGSAGIYRSRWRVAAILAAATLVRMDAALLIPAAIAAAMLAGAATPTLKNIVRARRFALIQVFSLAVALLVYLIFFWGYLDSVLEESAAIAAASVALTLAIGLATPTRVTMLRNAIGARHSRTLAIAAVIALFAYAAAVRPTLQPFAIIRQASGLDGQRDFREESLLNLATYLSWPILLFALAGVCLAIQRNWAVRRGLLWPLLLVIGIGPALLYLWAPQVSPDHPWAFRRFVPTVVPYVLLFAAFCVHALTRRLGRVGAMAGAVALLAPYALIVSGYPLQQILMRENRGVTGQLTSIARELPDGLIVNIGGDEEIASALFLAYGKPVAVVAGRAQNTDNIERVTKWIKAKLQLGHPAWLLHGPELWRDGVEIHDQREWWITRSRLLVSNRPPATQRITVQSQLILSRVNRLDPTFATRMFGGERIWGAHDGGFFDCEIAPFGQFRYTDGQAWIDVPAEALRGAQALKVDVFSYAKQGASHWISVLVDGQPAWTGDVGPGVSTLRVPVSGVIAGDIARIGILSQAVDPAEMNANDPRANLSIGLIGIRPLHADEPRASGPGVDGFRSHLASIGLPSEPERIPAGHSVDFVLDVTNTGREYWPSARELGSPANAIQIALRWYRKGNRSEFVGDNRWGLSVSMLPGDRTRLQVPLAPIGLDGKPLPPGEYDVHVGMVRETVALFADNGDEVLSIPVVVAP